MEKRRAVHVVDGDGAVVFTRLWDTGGATLEFDSGHGFVIRADLARYGYRLVAGWRKVGYAV